NNFTIALPLLKKHRIRAAFFIASGYLGGGAMFNDRVIEAIRRTAHGYVQLPDPEMTVIPLRTSSERRDAIGKILGLIRRLSPLEREARVVELERQLGVPLAQGSALMMSPEQVAALHHAGMCIGGHTRT